MCKYVVWFLMLGVVLLAPTVYAEDPVNVLPNPGFETGTGVPPTPWGLYSGGGATYAVVTDPAYVHSGSRSFSVTGAPLTGIDGPMQGNVSIDESGACNYRLKAWVKKTAALATAIRWKALDSGGNVVLNGYGPWDYTGAGDWVEITNGPDVMVFPTGVTALDVRVYAQPDVDDTGTVYIDDVGVWAEPSGVTHPSVSGTVTLNGEPIRGAAVGVKPVSNAVADATAYGTTDADGNYGPIYLAAGGTYQVAAWKEGYVPTGDLEVTVPETGGATAGSLNITTLAGQDIALGAPVLASSLLAAGYECGNVVDGLLTTRWCSSIVPDIDPRPTLTISLSDSEDKQVTGVTTYWEASRAGTYSIEAISGDVDPLTYDWDSDPDGVKTVLYSTAGTQGGYPIRPGQYVCPVRLDAPVMARGIRFVMDVVYPNPIFSIWEVVVHGSEAGGMIQGTVKDASGNPVPNAVVGVKTSASAMLDSLTCNEAGEDGTFLVPVVPGDYKVAAWTEGWNPSADVPVTVVAGGTATANPVIATQVGLNVALGKPTIASEYLLNLPDFAPGNMVDGDMAKRWACAETVPQYVIVDLEPTAHTGLDISGVSIFWESAWATAYEVQLLTTGDPMTLSNWDNPANYQVIYSTIEGKGGPQTPTGAFIAPIALASPVTATGLRIYMTGNRLPTIGNLSVWEIEAYSSIQTYGISDLGSLEDGTPVILKNKTVTCNPGVGGVPSGVFYIEEPDRFAGIRVASTTSVTAGQSVVVSGTMATTAGGERYVNASSVVPSSGTAVKPLGSNNRWVASSLMDGLLVRTCGVVRSIGSSFFVITDGSTKDGSELLTKVMAGGAPSVAVNDFVTVTGVAGYDSERVILVIP